MLGKRKLIVSLCNRVGGEEIGKAYREWVKREIVEPMLSKGGSEWTCNEDKGG